MSTFRPQRKQMFRLGRLLVAITSASSTLTLAAQASPTPVEPDRGQWEEVHRDELVTVYRMQVENDPVLALKGEGTLDIPMGKILSVVMDVERRAEWMEQVESAEIVKQFSPRDRIVYLHLDPPWPIRDRDAVLRETLEVDRANNKIVLHLKSVEDPARPKRDDRIRAHIRRATFELSPVDGGKRTAMVAESHADPKGSIPKWIVNLYQKRLPKKTLITLLKRVNALDVPEHPAARELTAAKK